MLRIRIGFTAYPDPAFFVTADPDPDPDPWMTKNWKKITAEIKLKFFDQKLQITYP